MIACGGRMRMGKTGGKVRPGLSFLCSLLQGTYIVYVICNLKWRKCIYIFRLWMKCRVLYVYYKIYKSTHKCTDTWIFKWISFSTPYNKSSHQDIFFLSRNPLFFSLLVIGSPPCPATIAISKSLTVVLNVFKFR